MSLATAHACSLARGRLVWVVLLIFLVVPTSGATESCKGNGHENQTTPTVCETVNGRPLDLVSTVCNNLAFSAMWYFFNKESGWVKVPNNSKSPPVLHLNGSYSTGIEQEKYRCFCQDDNNRNHNSYFQVEIRPTGAPPTPSASVKPDVAASSGDEYFLYAVSSELTALDEGRVCINVDSDGWPTPTYSWFVGHPNASSSSSVVEYTQCSDNTLSCGRCYTGPTSKKATNELCIFPTLDLLLSTSWPAQIKCQVSNFLGNITYFVNVTLPAADLSSGHTPGWFLRPHERQSFGSIAYNESGMATAYCGAYSEDSSVAVDYLVCDVTGIQHPSSCSLEPNDASTDLFCHPCAPTSGIDITMEPVLILNSVGMMAAGCRVTALYRMGKSWACMARRTDTLMGGRSSDHQMLGYFSFADSNSPVHLPGDFSMGYVVGLGVVGGFLVVFCMACLVCSCCCCRHKSKAKHLGRGNGEPHVVAVEANAEADEVVEGGQREEEAELEGARQLPDRGDGGEAERQHLIARPAKGNESGYGSVHTRTWPMHAGGRHRAVSGATSTEASSTGAVVTIVDTKMEGSVHAVVAQVDLTSQPGARRSPPPPQPPLQIFLPAGRKYRVSVAGVESSFILFVGELNIQARHGQCPYDIARRIPIPSTIEDALPLTRLKEVLDYLPDMAVKWFDIGAHLNMVNLARQLQATAMDSQTKITVIMQTWVEGGQGVSWQALIHMLETPAVGLGSVANKIKQDLYNQVPIVPDNIDFLQELTLEGLMHLVVCLAPYWNVIGERLKFDDKVAELSKPSCAWSDVIKMTFIFDAWCAAHAAAVEEQRKADVAWLNWLNLLDVLEPSKQAPGLAHVKDCIEQHIRDRVMWSRPSVLMGKGKHTY